MTFLSVRDTLQRHVDARSEREVPRNEPQPNRNRTFCCRFAAEAAARDRHFGIVTASNDSIFDAQL